MRLLLDGMRKPEYPWKLQSGLAGHVTNIPGVLARNGLLFHLCGVGIRETQQDQAIEKELQEQSLFNTVHASIGMYLGR